MVACGCGVGESGAGALTRGWAPGIKGTSGTHPRRPCGISRTGRGCVPGAATGPHTPAPTLRGPANSGLVCCAGGAPAARTLGCVPDTGLEGPWSEPLTCEHVRLNQGRASHTRPFLANRATHPPLRGVGPRLPQHTPGEFAGFRKLTLGVCGGGYTPAAILREPASWARVRTRGAGIPEHTRPDFDQKM